MSLSRLAVGVALVCVMGCSGAALAADAPVTPVAAQHGNQSPAVSNPSSVSVDGFGQAISASALGHFSGGSSLVQNNDNLSGTVSNDNASQATTGNNLISGGAFSGASGIPSVIQNTGNNVLIQNGVIVNVQMKQ